MRKLAISERMQDLFAPMLSGIILPDFGCGGRRRADARQGRQAQKTVKFAEMMGAIKILHTLSALLLFSLLGGCGPSPLAEPRSPLEGRSGNYDTTAVITYKELKATATILQESPEACLVSFASPDSLGDMAFVFRRDSVDVSYKGLSFQFDPQSLPGGAVAKVAVNAVNKAMKGDGVSLALTDAGMELTGMLEVGEFKLRLDADDGNLLKLSVPSEELEIEFINFRFLD